MRSDRPDRSATAVPTVLASLVVAAIALAGCFTTAADFQDGAETFILENEDLRTSQFGDSATAFATVTCTPPANRDAGTTFPCTATDTDGGAWEFEILITDSSGYEVNVARYPDGG